MRSNYPLPSIPISTLINSNLLSSWCTLCKTGIRKSSVSVLLLGTKYDPLGQAGGSPDPA